MLVKIKYGIRYLRYFNSSFLSFINIEYFQTQVFLSFLQIFSMIDKTDEVNDHHYQNQKHQLNFTTKMDDVNIPAANVELMDTSFEENLSEEHGKAIWNASIQLLKSCLKINFDQSKGFNDENLLQPNMELKDCISEKADSQELINKNVILSTAQKKQMIAILKKSNHLMKLVNKLYNDFVEDIFQQFVVLIHEILNKYLIDKQNTKLSQELARLLAPGYTEINVNDLKPKQIPNKYLQQTESQIIAKAQQAGIQVSNGMFVSTRIRLLNLNQIDGVINNSNAVRSQFQVFIETVAKAVYLCAEGCFQNSNEDMFFGINEEASFIERTSGEEDENVNNNNGRKRRNQ